MEPFDVIWQEAIRPEILNYDDWTLSLVVLEYSQSQVILNPQIWASPDKTGTPLNIHYTPDGYASTWTVGGANSNIPGDRNADELPKTFYLEATTIGSITLRLRLRTPSGEVVETETVAFTAIDPGVDVDGDSNNDGAINEADDPIEEDNPGYFIPLNRDDDNSNDVVDNNIDDAPFRNVAGNPMDDDDLRLVKFALLADAAMIPGYKVQFTNGPKI